MLMFLLFIAMPAKHVSLTHPSLTSRKDQSVLKLALPRKTEYVISCGLSTLQYFLYNVSWTTKIGLQAFTGLVQPRAHVY